MPGDTRKAFIKTRELRQTLSEVLERVEHGERVIVSKYVDPIAVLVPLRDYNALLRLDARLKQRPSGKEELVTYRIVVTNISGGEGKTSIARELAYVLAARGYRVALLDTDPQASLTKTLGLHDRHQEHDTPETLPGHQREHSVLPVFEAESGEATLGDPINVQGVDVWASNDHLYRADSIISGDLSRVGNLREALDARESRYDFIILDTKPGITPLLNAAVAAADHLVVPISGDKGMENLDKLVRLIKAARGFSPAIKVRLFIPNRVRGHTNIAKEMLDDLDRYAPLGARSRPIRDSVILAEAAKQRTPLAKYRPKADITQDLERVADDLLMELGALEADVQPGVPR